MRSVRLDIPQTAAQPGEVRGAARALLLLAMFGALASCAADGHRAQRDALRRIVQSQCLPAYRRQLDPAPCARLVVPVPGGVADGYAVLKDRKAGAHFLLIPTRTLAGIESPELLDRRTPNYFAAAWRARDVLDRWTGRSLPRDAVGLAINPQVARGQDQLHIHMECVGGMLYRTLADQAAGLGPAWSPLNIAGRRFEARQVLGEDLDGKSPFRLLAEGLPGARRRLGAYTLIVAGHGFAAGPGFVVLAATGAPGGETLLDARCAVSDPAAAQR